MALRILEPVVASRGPFFARVAMGAVLCAFGAGVDLHAQRAGLPDRISDAEFWRLVTELSERDGEFPDENYVSNESGYPAVMARLEESVAPGGVYLGVGPEQNFTYVAALRPAVAFVIDIRRQNAMLHLLYKALFETSADRVEFVSRLFSRPLPPALGPDAGVRDIFEASRQTPPDERLFQETLAAAIDLLVEQRGFDLTDADLEAIRKVLAAFRDAGAEIMYVFRGTPEPHPTYVQMMTVADAAGRHWSYLADEERFRRVQDLQRRNAIVPVVGDFAGPRALRAIGDYVRGIGGTVDVFYTSNVEPALFDAGVWRTFYDSVAALPRRETSLFVRTFFGLTVRECRGVRVPVRTPVIGGMRVFLEAYASGEIASQCHLVEP